MVFRFRKFENVEFNGNIQTLSFGLETPFLVKFGPKKISSDQDGSWQLD